MKKIIYILSFAVLAALAVILVYRLAVQDKIRQTPSDRYHEIVDESADKTVDEASEADVVTGETGDTLEAEGSLQRQSINTGEYSVEFIEYEEIDGSDIQSQTRYSVDNFYGGTWPVTVLELEDRDTEAIMAECPALADVWTHPENYAGEEVKRIFQENIDIVEKHTSMVQYEKKYFFVRCRIKNELSVPFELCLNETVVVVEDGSSWLDTMEYFDRSQHMEGDDRIHRFFWYTMQPGEELECVLGYGVPVLTESGGYYVGSPDAERTYSGMSFAGDKYMISLDLVDRMGD